MIISVKKRKYFFKHRTHSERCEDKKHQALHGTLGRNIVLKKGKITDEFHLLLKFSEVFVCFKKKKENIQHTLPKSSPARNKGKKVSNK